MIDALGLLLPIFAGIAIGCIAARRRWIDEAAIRGINVFTVQFAFPMLLFNSIATGSRFDTFGIAGVYLTGCLGVYALGLLIARVVLRARLARCAAFALNATYGSAAYIAMPLVASVFGTPGLTLIVPIIALHSGILLPLATILVEIGNHDDGGSIMRSTMRRLIRNAIVVSIVVGFLWRTGGLPVPAPLAVLLSLFGGAAPALALFCVGATLPNGGGGSLREAALAAVLKLGVLPPVIWALSVLAGFSGMSVKVALVTAAMPTGANAFLVARRATDFAETSARAVVISLLASLPVLSGLLIGLR